MSNRNSWLRCVLVGLAMGLPTAMAADPQVANSPASLAAAALQAEAEGDLLSRQRLLAEVTQLAPNFELARWQQGQLRGDGGQWIDVAASVEQGLDDERLSAYERRRASLPDNATSHWALASWCAERRLFDQCRSHLSRLLEFQPDHQAARAALGFTRVGEEWMSSAQLAELLARSERTQQAMAQFGPHLSTVRQGLLSNDRSRVTAAREALMELADPAAVLAVETVLASPQVELSQCVIDWLKEREPVDASQALARYSLFHSDAEVRQYASAALADRPLHDFVPDLLAMLAAPVNTMLVPSFDRRGSLNGYRHAFRQEKFDKIEFVVIDRGFQSFTLSLQSPGTAVENREASLLLNARQDSNIRGLSLAESLAREALVARENQAISLRNERVSDVLSQVAGAEFGGNAESMWQWWDDYNDTKYQQYKPERYRRDRLVDRVARYQVQPQQTCECFVAGTPVTTYRGPRAIEQLAVGDRVLSRDIESGELAWKPVLRVTTRPPEPTLVIHVGNETFQCTAGHLFWVSGKGWQKAKLLQPGDILHAAEEPMVVMSVKDADQQQTFNLQVADHANYFVGQSRLLTHDVTPQVATRVKIPGWQMLASGH